MSENFAMPAALELEQTRRQAIPAVRRKLIHNTTTQNEYRPGELCYIPVETGANGAFMDTATTRLKMTVVVRNKNYFTDFINLPRSGWHAIIQEFGIEINNTLHELNRHYAECIEIDMIKRGENRFPFDMTVENPWEPADGLAGKFSINFVKPSMVTLMGLPHNVHYKDFDTSTPDIITQAYCLYSNKFTHESFGTVGNVLVDSSTNPTTATTAPFHYYKFGGFHPSSFDVAQSFYDDRIQTERTIRRKYEVRTDARTDPTAYSGIAANTISTSGTNIGKDTSINTDRVTYSANNKIIGGPNLSNLANCSKVYPPNGEIGIYDVVYGQSVDNYSPGQWPAKQPTDLEKLNKSFNEQLRLVNCDNVLSYYANVQNIPVGIPVYLAAGDNGATEIWGEGIKTMPSIGDNGHETVFHISLRVYSSLIGVLANKWFPELVVPAGRMRVRIRFQEPNILFQLGADPCRRVPGTPRDWFPNLGVTSTSYSKYTTAAPTTPVLTELTASTICNANPSIITSGIHSIMISNYVPGECYNSSVAMGKYVLPQMKFMPTHELMKTFMVGSYGGTAGLPAAATVNIDCEPTSNIAGSTRAYNNFLGAFTDAAASTVSLGIVLPKIMNQIEHNMVIGNPIARYSQYTASGKPDNTSAILESTRDVHDVTSHWNTTIASLQNYTIPSNWQAFVANGNQEITAATPIGVLSQYDNDATAQPLWKQDQTWDWEYKHQCWNPFNTPTPQYLPMLNTNDKRVAKTFGPDDFVDESQIFFGTHLEKSKPQVRRTFGPLYTLNIKDQYKYGLNERLTYIVRDVQLESEQIILPRAAALSIVENALSGGITMETKTWKEMESMLPRAKSQKHLINMAAAYCTSLTFLFRPTDVYQGDTAYGYDSFSYYNPFTSFDYKEPDQQIRAPYNGLGGEPVHNNVFVVSERVPIDLQLQLASELLPRFPISTVSDLLLNSRWGDNVFDDRDYMELAPRFQPSYQVTKGQTINTLQDGYWSCYVPIYALDDQSITCNPFFTPAEISLKKKLRGMRHNLGPLPIYKPFKGTFHISFNLEAYMGQSERLRTGVPIVNNNMFLKFESAYLLEAYHTQLLTIAECDAKIVFERGGTMQFFT
jgi:hypothetical protein